MTSPHPTPDRRKADAGAPNGKGVADGNGAAPWNLIADFGRQQFAASTEAASLMFRGSESIRKIQQQAAHEASLRHQAALQKLQQGGDPADLLAVQAELLRFDFEQATHYWQQLAQSAMQTQVEMLGCASHLFSGQAASGLGQALQACQPQRTPPEGAGATRNRP